jgi:hypothetical protein
MSLDVGEQVRQIYSVQTSCFVFSLVSRSRGVVRLKIAAKPGDARMKYSGDDVLITDLHCIVSGTGAIPTVELIREVF